MHMRPASFEDDGSRSESDDGDKAHQDRPSFPSAPCVRFIGVLLIFESNRSAWSQPLNAGLDGSHVALSLFVP